MRCVVTGQERRETPEERVRQAIALDLIRSYGYRREDMVLELPIQMGASKDTRADLVIFRPETEAARRSQQTAYIIIECKRAGISAAAFDSARDQLDSYMAACRNCHYGMVVAGDRRASFRMLKEADGQLHLQPIPDLPRAESSRARFTIVEPSPPVPAHHDASARSSAFHAVPPVQTSGSTPPTSAGRLRRTGVALLLAATGVILLASKSFSCSASSDVPPPYNHSGTACPLAPWDGKVRGWAKLGSAQCAQPGVLTGHYLRVAIDKNKATSQSAVAQAWRSYVGTYLKGGTCPPAREMVFFDASGQTGAGLLFEQRPPAWDTVTRQQAEWRLIDGRNQPVVTPICFFPADDSRRPAGW